MYSGWYSRYMIAKLLVCLFGPTLFWAVQMRMRKRSGPFWLLLIYNVVGIVLLFVTSLVEILLEPLAVYYFPRLGHSI